LLVDLLPLMAQAPWHAGRDVSEYAAQKAARLAKAPWHAGGDVSEYAAQKAARLAKAPWRYEAVEEAVPVAREVSNNPPWLPSAYWARMGFPRNGDAMPGPYAELEVRKLYSHPAAVPAPTCRPPGMPPMMPKWAMQRERERAAAKKTTAGIANATDEPEASELYSETSAGCSVKAAGIANPAVESLARGGDLYAKLAVIMRQYH